MVREEDFYTALSDDEASYPECGSGTFTTNKVVGHGRGDMKLPPISRVMRILLVLTASTVLVYCMDIISVESCGILIISILFTWSHIWLALKMCFHPLSFKGVTLCGLPIGWQGIVPQKAERMASKSCDLMIDRLIFVNRIIDRIAGTDFLNHLKFAGLLASLEARVRDRLKSSIISSSRVLRMLPGPGQEILLSVTSGVTDSVCIRFVEELKLLLKDRQFLDIRELIISEFVSNKELLVHLFTQVGSRELEFIEIAGALMGLLCGLFQIGMYSFSSVSINPYLLFSLGGLVIGYLTNWTALFMIFRPVEPISVYVSKKFHFVVQGLFLRRQREASAVYAEIVTGAVLNVEKTVEFLRRSGKWCRIEKLFDNVLSNEMDAILNKPAFPSSLRQKITQEVREEVAAILRSDESLSPTVVSFLESRMQLKRTIVGKLEALPPSEFEQMLHPVFQEDEFLLILIGAGLGAAVGALQVFIFHL